MEDRKASLGRTFPVRTHTLPLVASGSWTRDRTIEDGWFSATERESGTERWEEVIGGLLDCVWLITSGSVSHTHTHVSVAVVTVTRSHAGDEEV